MKADLRQMGTTDFTHDRQSQAGTGDLLVASIEALEDTFTLM